MGFTVAALSAATPPAAVAGASTGGTGSAVPRTPVSPESSVPARSGLRSSHSATTPHGKKQVRIDTSPTPRSKSKAAAHSAFAAVGHDRKAQYRHFVTKLRIALFTQLGDLQWRRNLRREADEREDPEFTRAADEASASNPVPPIVFITSDIPTAEMAHVSHWFTHAFVCIIANDTEANNATGETLSMHPPPSLADGPAAANVVYLTAGFTNSDLRDVVHRAAQYWHTCSDALSFDPAQEAFWSTDSPSLSLTSKTPRRRGTGVGGLLLGGSSGPVKNDTADSSLGLDGDNAFRRGVVNAVANNQATVDQMGSGAFSIVYHVRGLTCGMEFAMKRIVVYKPQDRQAWTSGTEEQYRAEVRRGRTSEFETEPAAFLALDHPNIVRPYFAHEYTLNDGITRQVDVYMEYCEGGTLATRCRSSPPTPHDLFDLTRATLRALHHLHAQGISHLDIKPENILFRDGVAKLADFGIARRGQHGEAWDGIELGTRNYMAPEVIINSGVSCRADIFSFGVLLSQMLHLIPEHLLGEGVYDTVITRIRSIFTDRNTFPATYSMRLFFNTDDGRHEVTTSLSQERLGSMAKILQLLSHCLCVIPDERFTAARLLELDILKDRQLFVTQVEALLMAAVQFHEKYKRRGVASNALSFNSAFPPSAAPGGELTSQQLRLQKILSEPDDAAEPEEPVAEPAGDHAAAPAVAMPDPDYNPFSVDASNGDAFSGLRAAAKPSLDGDD